MIVAFGSDIKTAVTDAIERWLRERGHGVVLEGVLATGDDSWPRAGRGVAVAVAEGRAQSGIVCCWTGTGVSIAANKVSGVRAALCGDAPTAAGAREWNDANVLALSLRATSEAMAIEILEAWFAGRPTGDPKYRAMIESVEGAIQGPR